MRSVDKAFVQIHIKINVLNILMENINEILGRQEIANQIKKILGEFDANCKNVNYNKGIYIYGEPGTGKTQFIIKILE